MSTAQLECVRTICLALPDATECLSHGEPTFFIGKRVFTMFAGNHHNDGHTAVWLPVPVRCIRSKLPVKHTWILGKDATELH